MSEAPQPSALEGLELWAVTFALDRISVQFGPRRKAPTRRDPEREVGKYALHAECRHETLENGAAVKLRELVETRGPLKVLAVREEPLGTLTLDLDGGVVFRVIGDPNAPNDDDNDGEQWRLFTPGQNEPHLVFVGGRHKQE